MARLLGQYPGVWRRPISTIDIMGIQIPVTKLISYETLVSVLMTIEWLDRHEYSSLLGSPQGRG